MEKMPDVSVSGPAKHWPMPSDYNDEIQDPSICFGDPELKCCRVVGLDRSGLPRPNTGQFAAVYKVETQTRVLAVRCFVRPVTDQRTRYAQLSHHLEGIIHPFMVDFAYQPQGIRVRGDWYPIVRMEWVEGQTLDQYVDALVHEQRLDLVWDLARKWRGVVAGLFGAHTAHGDLQHGNILVESSGQIRLVDYDGFFLPSLRGDPPGEKGHPNYQHPERIRSGYYEERTDAFSASVIYLSLLGLMVDLELWDDFYTGENLLFTAADYDPARAGRTRIWQKLQRSTEPAVRELSTRLEDFCRRPVSAVPDFEGVIENLPPISAPRAVNPARMPTSSSTDTAPAQVQPPTHEPGPTTRPVSISRSTTSHPETKREKEFPLLTRDQYVIIDGSIQATHERRLDESTRREQDLFDWKLLIVIHPSDQRFVAPEVTLTAADVGELVMALDKARREIQTRQGRFFSSKYSRRIASKLDWPRITVRAKGSEIWADFELISRTGVHFPKKLTTEQIGHCIERLQVAEIEARELFHELKDVVFLSQTFTGKTLAQARARAKAAVSPDRVVDINVIRDVQEYTESREGETPAAAIAMARSLVPPNAFFVDEPKVTEKPAQQGQFTLEAANEADAQRQAKFRVPTGAEVALQCRVKPKLRWGGLLGVAKMGEWQVVWKTRAQFRASITYRIPAEVRLRHR